METTGWKRCSACKKPIAFGQLYWVCNVSTCNRKRTALSFCTVSCWEVHLPIANHREAWAEERRAPSEAQARTEAARARGDSKPRATEASAAKPSKRTSATASRSVTAKHESAPTRRPSIRRPGRNPSDGEVLVVASKLKDYIRQTSGFNTSDRVLRILSDAVRRDCDIAIGNARRAERRTVLDRDFPRH